jgi:hypothetical protein
VAVDAQGPCYGTVLDLDEIIMGLPTICIALRGWGTCLAAANDLTRLPQGTEVLLAAVHHMAPSANGEGSLDVCVCRCPDSYMQWVGRVQNAREVYGVHSWCSPSCHV